MDTDENLWLIRLKPIGDILFTLRAVHLVRENFTDERLFFPVSKETRYSRFPGNSRGYPSQSCGFLFEATRRSTLELLRCLREPKVYPVIDFQGCV